MERPGHGPVRICALSPDSGHTPKNEILLLLGLKNRLSSDLLNKCGFLSLIESVVVFE